MFKRIAPYFLVMALTMVLTTVCQPLSHLPVLAQGGCQTFPETGKTVCGKFLAYWQQHGGLPQQGYPISNSFDEVSELNGKVYTVQYFERAVFEAHPENQPPYDVLLSQLGTFQFKRKYPSGEPGGIQPTPTTQAQSIVGQVVDLRPLSGKTTLRGTVTDVKEATSIPPVAPGDKEVKPQGKFVLVFITVENTGTESAQIYVPATGLKDSRGRTFDMIWPGTAAVDQSAAAYQRKTAWYELQPSFKAEEIFVYDVAVDSTGYILVTK